ncbi:hypothetical protein [Nocardioides sp. HB32]
MSKFVRWAALAMFCAVFGLLGSVAGAALMHGETGKTGPAGPVGPAGPTGPAGQASDTSGLRSDLDQLGRRVTVLEVARTSADDDRCAMVSPLVTDVTVGFSGDLDVTKTPFFVCVNP